MTDKGRILIVDGKKYIQKLSDGWCDEPFRYLESITEKTTEKENVRKGKEDSTTA